MYKFTSFLILMIVFLHTPLFALQEQQQEDIPAASWGIAATLHDVLTETQQAMLTKQTRRRRGRTHRKSASATMQAMQRLHALHGQEIYRMARHDSTLEQADFQELWHTHHTAMEAVLQAEPQTRRAALNLTDEQQEALNTLRESENTGRKDMRSALKDILTDEQLGIMALHNALFRSDRSRHPHNRNHDRNRGKNTRGG